jgi:hypothetical protein
MLLAISVVLGNKQEYITANCAGTFVCASSQSVSSKPFVKIVKNFFTDIVKMTGATSWAIN